MSISALNIGITGLRANQRALDVSSHNIANANTRGFQPQQAAFQEGHAGGVVVNISQSGNQALETAAPATDEASGTDLTSELVHSIQYKVGFDLSAQIVKTSAEILGTLVDLKA